MVPTPARALLAAIPLLLTTLGLGHASEGMPGHGTDATLDRAAALETSQGAVGTQVRDWTFRDRRGRPVRLAALRGRPLVVSPIYTSCDHTCPLITQSLARAADAAWDALGADSFAVATVGFDTAADTPARLRLYARDQGVGADNWLFLSGDPEAIKGLTRDLGFTFTPSMRGFDHIAQTTILDAEGRVYQQIYGETIETPALVEPLKRLALGRAAGAGTLDGLVERVRLFCTFYDPARDRYRFDYSILIGIVIGLGSLGAVAVFLVRAWRQGRGARTAT